jgi:hypothetical protein
MLLVLIPVIGLVAAACSSPVVDDLYPLIGTGKAGSSGDAGPALAAKLNQPTDVAVDEFGPVCPGTPPCTTTYVADAGNNRIRRVVVQTPGAPDGLVDTLPIPGLLSPKGVATNFGAVFVSDSGNKRVLRVDEPGNAVTPIAGGGAGSGPCATQAKLKDPQGIAVVGADLLLADTGNNVIWRIYGVADVAPAAPCIPGSAVVGTTPGTIALVAGTLGAAGFSDNRPATAARLSGPRDVAPYNDGFVIADTDNARIRKVDGGGIITTLAGMKKSGYNGDCGDPLAARLDQPSSIAVVSPIGAPSQASIYFTDTKNDRLRRIDVGPAFPAPRIVTVAQMYQKPIDGPKTLPQALKKPVGVVAGSVQTSGGDTSLLIAHGIVIADTGNNVVGGMLSDANKNQCATQPAVTGA